jgi:hypothetical protein
MKILPKILGTVISIVVGAVFGLATAHAADLIVADQSALKFVCTFDADCGNSITPSGVGALPASQTGSDPRLQWFNFAAKPGTPGAGNTAYVYRVDLTKADAFSECMAGLVVNFGPAAQLSFEIAKVAHVFVITTGGLGTVGIKSAE